MHTKSLTKSPKAWFIAIMLGMTVFASGCSTTGHSGSMGGFLNARGNCFVTVSGTPWCR